MKCLWTMTSAGKTCRQTEELDFQECSLHSHPGCIHREAVATRTRRMLGWQSCSQRTPMMSSMLLFYAEIPWHSDRPPDSRSRWFLPVFRWFEGRVSTTLGAFEAPCRKPVGRGPSHGLQIPEVGFKPWPLLSLSKIVIHYPWNWYPLYSSTGELLILG